jgi:hypothetical protein
MLLTFRLFLGGASIVILALTVIARGLIPVPDVRTRIGEVPSLGRSLIQQAMIPRAFIDVSDDPTGKRAEESTGARQLSDTEVALVQVPGSASTGTSPASEPALAAASWDETPPPSALPEVATTAETPVSSRAPALAFAAENATAPATGEDGERTGAAPSEARTHEAKTDAARYRSGKRTKKVRASKQKSAARPTKLGSLGLNLPASLSPTKAEPRVPYLVGRLLHPESLVANPRVGDLTAHSASVLGGKTDQMYKLESRRRMDVSIWGLRTTADVKAHGQRGPYAARGAHGM